jgi:mycothiol synthase
VPEQSVIRPVTRGDLPEIVDLLNAVDAAEIGRPDTSAEDVETDWNEEGFDLARDAWVAVEPDGEPTGYAYAGDQFRTGELEGDVYVHPEKGEPGLARRLLDAVERRAAERAAERAYVAPRLSVFSFAGNEAKRLLLEEGGYTVRRRVLRMAADLGDATPVLEPPEGVEIRPFDPEADDHTMHEVMHEAFEDHFRQSEEPFEAWRRRLMGHADFDPGLWLLAWAGREPVGGLIAYDHGDLGWVKGLGVLSARRGRGVGGALLSRVFATLRARGQDRVELGVDAEGTTRAVAVYERAGMHVELEYLLYERPLA